MKKRTKLRFVPTSRNKSISKENSRRKNNFSEKRTTKRNPYLSGGYTFGDNRSLREIYEICANDKTKKLDWEYLDTSRYLRFWPGKKDEAESMWTKVCGEDGCSLETLMQFHAVLDSQAALIYRDMENERVQWEDENLVSDLLEKYFAKACNKNCRLEFSQFMAWDVIVSEMWYANLDDRTSIDYDFKVDNEEDNNGINANNELQIAYIWKKYADEHNTVSYDDFRTIYECICTDKLTLYSSDFKPGVINVAVNDKGNDDDDEEEE